MRVACAVEMDRAANPDIRGVWNRYQPARNHAAEVSVAYQVHLLEPLSSNLLVHLHRNWGAMNSNELPGLRIVNRLLGPLSKLIRITWTSWLSPVSVCCHFQTKLNYFLHQELFQSDFKLIQRNS